MTTRWLLGALVPTLVVLTGCTSEGSREHPPSPEVSTSASDSSSPSPSASSGTAALSVDVTAIRGHSPVRIRLSGPAGTTFRLRTSTGEDKPCSVLTEADGVGEPFSASIERAEYLIRCEAATARGAVLEATTSADPFTYEFETALDPDRSIDPPR